ncbi:MAG: ABC transporter substrate-binding protein [Methylacidiphilales bacterium]|nr:ABC transporter substrate-binding protein [Candidatus Methylacidiphilales bacterium]
MLEPDPKNRYQSADEVIQALRNQGIIDVEKKSKSRMIWLWMSLGIAGFGLLLALIWQIVIKPEKIPLSSEYFTRGEKSLLAQDIKLTNPDCQAAFTKKQAGMDEFAKTNYKLAEANFKAAIDLFQKGVKSDTKTCYIDPETVIFWNNAKANSSTKVPLTVAIVIPFDIESNIVELRKFSEQLLRGIAHRQNNFNQVQNQINNQSNTRTPGLNGTLLEIVIARDDNKEDISKRVAKHIIDNQIPGDNKFQGRNILAIVGNFTSRVLLAAGEEYNKHQIVTVSPSSTAIRQAKKLPNLDYEYNLGKYVFRIAPNDAIAAKDLSKYIKNSQNNNSPSKEIGIFFNSKEIYSKSLKESLSKNFDASNVITCDLSKYNVQGCLPTIKNTRFWMLSLGIGDAERVFSITQARTNNLPLLGGDALYNDDKLTSDTNIAKTKDMVLAVPFDIESASEQLKDELKQLWGTQKVGWRTAATYDALQVILDGLQQQSNNPTRQNLYRILSSKSFKSFGMTGEIKFDNNSDRKVEPKDTNRLGILVKVSDRKCKPEDKNDNPKYRFCTIQP